MNSQRRLAPSSRRGQRHSCHSLTTKHVRKLLDAAGFEWAVGHTFRKTAATWMDADPNTSPREVANQLGHKRASMTMDVYMSRRTVSPRAAQIL